MSDDKDDKAIKDEELDEISGGRGVDPQFRVGGHGRSGGGEGIQPDVGGTLTTPHHGPIPHD